MLRVFSRSGFAEGLRSYTRFLDFSSLRARLPELALASTTVNILNLALPLAMLQIYDRIIPHQSGGTLGLLMGGVIVALFLESGVRFLRTYITGWIGASFEHRLSCAAFRRLLDTNFSDYGREGPTSHLERMRAAGLVREFYSGQAILSLFDLPFVGIYLGLVWLLGGWLILVPIVLLIAFVGVGAWNSVGLRKFTRKRTEMEERRFSFVAQTLGGIHSVKTMAMESMMQRRYEMLQDTNVHQTFDGSRHSIVALNIGAVFSQLSTVIMVAAGAVFVVNGHLTPGALAACITLTGRCLSPLQGAMGTFVRFQGLMVAQQQIDRVLELPHAGNIGAPPLPALRGGLTMEGVSYRFPSAKSDLLTDINLTVAPGECIVIQGDSGSGKTSLLELMAGQLPPTAGRVTADGHDIGQFASASLPLQIGYLPQQGELLSGTILENLTMYRPDLEAKAIATARATGLDRVIAAMRNGYATQVGNTAGDSVPGGVRQRVAIARALVSDPAIILFDEANIALDSASDDALRAYLAALKGQRTMVLVTHRPSLLKLADRQFALHQGRLVKIEEKEALAAAAAARHAAELAALKLEARPPTSLDPNVSLASRFRVVSDLALCLPKMLEALDWKGSPRQFAEALPHIADVLDLDVFRKVMAILGFKAHFQDVTPASFHARLMPCLFLPENGDALVIQGRETDGRLRCFDGSSGREIRVQTDVLRGRIFQFSPIEAIRPLDGGNWMASIIARFRPLMLLALLLTIVINVLTLGGSAFVMVIYDRVVPSGNLAIIPLLLAGLAIVLALDWKVRGLRARILSYMGARGEYIVGTAIFQRILALPASATEQVPVGSQVSRIKDFESLRDLFVGPLALLLYELPGTLVFVVVLTMINGWFLAVLLGSVACYCLLAVFSKSMVQRATTAASQAGSKRQELLSDTLFKMKEVKYSGAEDVFYERYRQLSARGVAAEFKSNLVSSFIATAAQTLGTLTALSIVTAAVVATFLDPSASGGVVVAMILTWRLVTPLQNGFMSLSTIVRVSRSVKQIDNLMRMTAEKESVGPRAAVPDYRGEITFNRASFRYSNDADPALLGVTFKIEPGQVAAIAGPNGAGKSSLLKLVTGLYAPQAGNVRLDNVDIRQFDTAMLRGLISYAPQRCDVFYGTIAQNFRLSHPVATDDEIRWAVDLAGLTDDIKAMKDGMNTRIVDAQGEQLPHGFRQRLSLARAYLKPAPVMLFDEPGNGLDDAGDRAFLKAIDRLRKNMTILFVSHRPSHLKIADQVIYLQEGYVRQVGTYAEVSNLVLGVA